MRPPAHIARAIAQQQEARSATAHQDFIRALPCAACGKPAPSECASVGFHRGLGAPANERDLVPLCGPATIWEDCCHSRKHFRGASRFWAGLGIDARRLAFRLWRVSGDVDAGEREIRYARQRMVAPRGYWNPGSGVRSRLRPGPPTWPGSILTSPPEPAPAGHQVGRAPGSRMERG